MSESFISYSGISDHLQMFVIPETELAVILNQDILLGSHRGETASSGDCLSHRSSHSFISF